MTVLWKQWLCMSAISFHKNNLWVLCPSRWNCPISELYLKQSFSVPFQVLPALNGHCVLDYYLLFAVSGCYNLVKNSNKAEENRQMNEERLQRQVWISSPPRHQGLRGPLTGETSCEDRQKTSWYDFKMLGKWLETNAREPKGPKTALCLPLFISLASYGTAKWINGESENF